MQPLCKTNKFCVCNLQNVLSLEQIVSCGVRSMAHCFEITKCKKLLNRSQSFPIVESYLALQFIHLFIEYSFKSFSSTCKQNCPSIKTFAFFTWPPLPPSIYGIVSKWIFPIRCWFQNYDLKTMIWKLWFENYDLKTMSPHQNFSRFTPACLDFNINPIPFFCANCNIS